MYKLFAIILKNKKCHVFIIFIEILADI